MGKLIAIEGVDASGKETQSALLYEALKKKYPRVRKVRFPDYESPSSGLVRMYLRGDFGEDPQSVDPYIASTFYAGDRYASYMTDWKKDYEAVNGIILADRYTTANAIHQAAKLNTEEEKEAFLEWLSHFEYGLYGLPKPDLVIFLHMPLYKVRSILAERGNKVDTRTKCDIHERSDAFMERSYYNALYVAEKLRFSVVSCESNGKIRSIEDISQEILKLAEQVIGTIEQNF